MLAEIKLEFDDETKKRIDGFLQQLSAKAANVDGALKNVGEALLQTTHERFEQAQDPDGKAWKPLSELTKKLRGAGGSILLRSGRLRSSISYRAAASKLELGPNTVDAALHQFGGEIVPKNRKALRIPGISGGRANRDIFVRKVTIPARPYIGFGRQDIDAAQDALEDWFDMEQEAGSV